MKRFYESPVVEITIFDAEDVIATAANAEVTSIVVDTAADTDGVAAMLEAINTGRKLGIKQAKKFSDTFGW